MAPSFLFGLALYAFCIARITASICYGHYGNENPAWISCDANAKDAACCHEGDKCYSNGICGPGPDQTNASITPFYYGGCTDRTWEATACFSQCLNKTEGTGLATCPQLGVGYYCCYGYDGCDCTDPRRVVSIPAGTIMTTIPIDFSTSTTSSTTFSTGSASTSPTQIPSNPNSSPTAGPSPGASSMSRNIGIGVGVGLGSAAILIALTGFFCWKRRSQRNRIQENPVSNPPSYMDSRAEMDTEYSSAGSRFGQNGTLNTVLPELHDQGHLRAELPSEKTQVLEPAELAGA